jgi:DNA-binding NarL/FixJ family response regulator
MITISILEDNEILRNRFQSIVEKWENVSASFAFETNQGLIRHSRYCNYDVALIDLDLPDGNGIQSITHLAKIQPTASIIVISALSDAQSIFHAIECGAIGYIHKDDTSSTLHSTVEMALCGESPISPMVARKIFAHLQKLPHSMPLKEKSNQRAGQCILTDRELQVLHLIAKGLSYSEVATTLEISSNTVPSHIRKIYKKLQVNNRSEAVFEARQLGIIE